MSFLYIVFLSALALVGAPLSQHARYWRTGAEMVFLAAIGSAVFYTTHGDWTHLERIGALAIIGLSAIGGMVVRAALTKKSQLSRPPISKKLVDHEYTVSGYTKKPDDFNIV